MTPLQNDRPVLHAFLDESADETRVEVYSVGAFLAAEANWEMIEAAWSKRLAEDAVPYFRATDCRAVIGPFRSLRRKYGGLEKAREAAACIRSDLEAILLSYHWIGFGIGVVVADYDEVLRQIPETASSSQNIIRSLHIARLFTRSPGRSGRMRRNMQSPSRSMTPAPARRSKMQSAR